MGTDAQLVSHFHLNLCAPSHPWPRRWRHQLEFSARIGKRPQRFISGGVHAKTNAGLAYLSVAIAFADHRFTTNRVALGDQLQANFAGQSYEARLRPAIATARR
jgi:hypothetical protein